MQDTLNPKAYQVDPDQMVVLSAINKNNEDWDFAEGQSVENYFGGVYIQVYSENENAGVSSSQRNYTYVYSLPKNCTESFPETAGVRH